MHEDILVRACGVRVCWKCQTSNFAKFIHRFVIETVSVSGIWFVTGIYVMVNWPFKLR